MYEFNKKNPMEMTIHSEDDNKDLSQRRTAGTGSNVPPIL